MEDVPGAWASCAGMAQRLRLSEVRALYRLLVECRELGADAQLWRRNMLIQICQLTGSLVGICGDRRFTEMNWSASPVEVGWSSTTSQLAFAQFMQGGGLEHTAAIVATRLARTRRLTMTMMRRELMEDEAWYRSGEFTNYHRPAGLDDQICSVAVVPQGGNLSIISLHRAIGHAAVQLHEVRLVDLLHQELRPMLGEALAMTGEPGVAELAPRLRQVLADLLDGLSEKQIAQKLKLRRPTVHQYVTALHQHFAVNSRGELMAHFLRRQIVPADRWLRHFDRSA
jgi:DNA-binding CsgD family transcriptional regulator